MQRAPLIHVAVSVVGRSTRSLDLMFCPNCAAALPMETDTCARCGALFGPGAAWTTVARKPQGRTRGPRAASLGNAVYALPIFALSVPLLVVAFSGFHPAVALGLLVGIPVGGATGVVFALTASLLGHALVIRGRLGAEIGSLAALVVALFIDAIMAKLGAAPLWVYVFFAVAGCMSGWMSGALFPVGRASETRFHVDGVPHEV